ncbi:transposable element Tcb2 transposase [Trichonephila clavipes]|nr:transposable element Tcb2 transposase [Trichonephila clavipes]
MESPNIFDLPIPIDVGSLELKLDLMKRLYGFVFNKFSFCNAKNTCEDHLVSRFGLEAKRNLCDVFGVEAVTARTCQRWFLKCRLDNFSLEDEPSSERPSDVSDEVLRSMIITNSTLTSTEVLRPVDPRNVIYQAHDALYRPVIEKTVRVQATASSAAIQEQLASSLRAPMSSRTIRRRLAERHLGSRRLLRVLPLTPSHRCLRLKWCRARGNWTAAEWNQVVISDETRFNLSSDDNRVRVWRPRGERLPSCLCFTVTHSWCDGMQCHCLQYTVTPSIDP